MKPAPMPAEDALAYLAHGSDTLQSRGRTLFVVELPSNPEGEAVLDAVIAAAGAWLADVLARIADHPARDLDALLPWNWRPAALSRSQAA